MRTYIILSLLLIIFSIKGMAQDEADPAKAAQNPLANVISLPLQNNANFGIGTYNKTSDVLNIQPVIPAKLNKKGWLLISRAIIPLPKSVPDNSSENASNTTGLGDISYSAFFTPPAKGKFTYGFGPVTIWPTASNDKLGAGKFSIGPTLVLVYVTPKWMGAAIVSDWVSVAGDEDRADVNTFFFNYILTYFLQKKWYLSTAPIVLANWEAEKDQRWTVPFGGGFGKMFKAGKMPMDLQTQAFYNVVKPDGAADWTWRVQLKLIFPTGKK